MNKSKSTRKTLYALIVLMVILGGIVYFLMPKSNTQPVDIIQADVSFNEDKYQVAVKKINELISIYQSNIFTSSKFLSLKSFISLPLEIGLIGKANPFELPLSPTELLQSGKTAP